MNWRAYGSVMLYVLPLSAAVGVCVGWPLSETKPLAEAIWKGSIAAVAIAGALTVMVWALLQGARRRRPELDASALIAKQTKTLALPFLPHDVFASCRRWMEGTPRFLSVRAEPSSSTLFAVTATPSDAGRGAIRRLIDRIIVGCGEIVTVEVAGNVANSALVTISSRSKSRWEFLDVTAQNVENVETIADALRAAASQREAREREEAERAKAAKHLLEARLQTLQAQVEPHFLYNTLANVQFLIRTDPQAADRMVGRLIDYLREALPQMRASASTIGREIALASAYLDILKIRMGARLSFSVALPDDLAPHPFPPMMLMSLVENAIKHGLEPKPGGGQVAIEVSATAQHLRVCVRDDGMGFRSTEGSGVGLANLRDRLAAMFGADGSLAVDANGGDGWTAVVAVPLRQEAPAGTMVNA